MASAISTALFGSDPACCSNAQSVIQRLTDRLLV